MPDRPVLIGLKTCDTCRKALKDMENAGLAPQFRDVRDPPLTPAEVADILAVFGEKAVNRASTTWRALPESDRALPPQTLLARFPTLLKRPVIRHRGALTMGWAAATRAQVLG